MSSYTSWHVGLQDLAARVTAFTNECDKKDEQQRLLTQCPFQFFSPSLPASSAVCHFTMSIYNLDNLMLHVWNKSHEFFMQHGIKYRLCIIVIGLITTKVNLDVTCNMPNFYFLHLIET